MYEYFDKGKYCEVKLARTNTELARNCNYVAIRLQSESNAESNTKIQRWFALKKAVRSDPGGFLPEMMK